jgi:hypothetical protein
MVHNFLSKYRNSDARKEVGIEVTAGKLPIGYTAGGLSSSAQVHGGS